MITGPVQNLCNYSDVSTTAVFDIITGQYTFTSTDFPTFGIQTVAFEITGSTASSSDLFTFTLNMKDPCENASIIIDPTIISSTILYVINEASS